ncbi:AraC family transcriptional regulator [Sandaracinobacter neustonicus]|uniref:AraC family transcriptional regulator n=1 Tax=Sandaracinobacter neustonicus TaxID=1715348 RepID=A0A501XPM1_9SPHN|nr:helix-turn-helix domain-containing protein [Sandaracinobacter neustonicus]TPE62638.1 AraC family transcriptional regulator [Sandaracinobacter neustonicus]
MQQSLSIRFRIPQVALAGHVTSVYFVDCGEEGVDDWLHPEWGNIRFALAGDWTWSPDGLAGAEQITPAATLFGPTARAARFTGSAHSRVIGIGLTPLGWAQLVRQPARTLANKAVPLASHMAGTDDLCAQLAGATDPDSQLAMLERWLLAGLVGVKPAAPIVERLQRALVTGNISTVPAFASELCVSERTLERLCPRLFGFPPKQLLRRQRFLRSLDTLQRNPGQNFTSSMDGRYTDQSHFVREFRAHMGMNPSAYFALPRPLLTAAGIARADMLGDALQGLHMPREA